MIGPQVVDLLAKQSAPKFLADEFNDVQFIFESAVIFCQLLGKLLTS